MTDLADIWAYLSRGPLLWLTATALAFVAADALAARIGRPAWANPVAGAVALVALALAVTGTPYAEYFEGAQFIHFLLGPATVALAVPLAAELPRVRRALLPAAAAILAGSFTGAVSALAIAAALGAAPASLASLAPKSATAPVAMGVAEGLGGAPTLAAVLVILTGVTGAVLAPPLLTAVGLRDPRARGLAIGVAAHGIGTARAMQEGEAQGAWSGLGMGLNALATAALAPLALWLVAG